MNSNTFLTIIFLIVFTIQNDSYTLNGNYSIGAQRIHYGTNVVAVSRNVDNSILIFLGRSSSISQILINYHKQDIKSLAFNQFGTKLASGGQDFIVIVYNINNSSLDCKFIQIHGFIQQLLWLSDNVRLVGVSDSGYVYIFNTSDCSKLAERQLYGQRLMSVLQRSPANQLWIANYGNKIYRLNYDLTDAAASFTVGTSRLVSLFTLPSNVQYSGVCTQKAFYLYNGLTLVHTRNYLASPTTRCRISNYITNYTGSTSVYVPGYFISAASGYNSLWQIWKLELSSPYTWLIRVQPDDNRHLSKVHTVQLYSYQYNTISTVSSSQNSFYINTVFSDTTTTICDPGTFSSLRIFATWHCTLCVDIYDNNACYNCKSDTVCGICYDNYYKSGNDCLRCPQNCYQCSSSTDCSICHPQIASDGRSTCFQCNITNCIDCLFDGSFFSCAKCLNGFYLVNNKSCQPCNKQIQNCLQCSSETMCTLCQSSYRLVSTNTTCQPCSLYMKGCQDCITITFCDFCNKTTMPYYNYVSPIKRYCQNLCHYKCIACSFYYNNCTVCDANRTLITLDSILKIYICDCKNGYFQDLNKNNTCINCSDLISQCSTCDNTTYCNTCNLGFYFNPTALGYRSCLACNYSCGACSSSGNYYDCSSCIASNNRMLVNNRCQCNSLAFYQVYLIVSCISCSSSISNCLTCYNATFCLTCANKYYLNTTSAGNVNCLPCGNRCSTCQNGSNHCTSCNLNQNRQLNLTTFLCDCYFGYLQTFGNDICQKCSYYLSSCDICTNTSVCITCTNNNFFEINSISGVLQCGLCKSPCLTCNIWSHICSTCSSTALRVLNPITKTCDCIIGYVQSQGYCLNCNSTFSKCIDCNTTHCKACQPKYALSISQLQCLNCSQILIGCLDCLNGICSKCDSTKNFILSLIKCICNNGYYYNEKKENCLPYALGSLIKRYFTLTTLINLDFFNQNALIITTEFAIKEVYFLNGAQNSFNLYINGLLLNSSQYSISQPNNYTLQITYITKQSIPRAEIILQFLQNHVYDKSEYQLHFSFLKQMFYKNLYAYNTNSSLTIDIQEISGTIKNYINFGVRYTATFFVILGSIDIVILFISMYHIFPLYLMMQLSIPGQLQEVLKSMIIIHQDSLFYVPYSDQLFQQNNYSNSLTLNQFSLGNSFFYTKHIDLLFFVFVFLIYGIIGHFLLNYVQKGKRFKLWKGKFEQRRYSTIAITVLTLMAPFMAGNNFDYYGRSFNPGYDHSSSLVTVPLVSNYWILAEAILFLAFFFGFIFFHICAISLWRLKQDVKTQDCYMGISKIDTRCDLFVLSQLLYWVFVPSAIFYANGLIFLILSTLLVLWNLSFYRFWILFPNKAVYFCKLFSQIGVLLFNLVFLVYYVSQIYVQIQVRILIILGYLALTCLILTLGLNLILAIIFLIQTILRLYKTNNSILQQIAIQNNIKRQSKIKVKDLKGRITNILSTKKIAKIVQCQTLNYYNNRQMSGEDSQRSNYQDFVKNKNIFTRNRKILMEKGQYQN